MITRRHLEPFVQHRPFKPFAIEVSDGKEGCTISHPDGTIVIGNDTLSVADPSGDIQLVPLHHVTRLYHIGGEAVAQSG